MQVSTSEQSLSILHDFKLKYSGGRQYSLTLPSGLTCFLKNCLGHVSGLVLKTVVTSFGIEDAAVLVDATVLTIDSPVVFG